MMRNSNLQFMETRQLETQDLTFIASPQSGTETTKDGMQHPTYELLQPYVRFFYHYFIRSISIFLLCKNMFLLTK